MRVAVVLTGQMRGWEKAKETWNWQIFNRAECDVFIETWTERGWYSGTGYLKPDVQTGYIRVKDNDKGYYEDKEALIDPVALDEAYHPKYIALEDFSTVEKTIEERAKYFVNAYTRPKNSLAQFYKIQRGLVAMFLYAAKTGTQYDLVVRARPDLVIQAELPTEFNANIFYYNPGRNPRGIGCGDQLHISGMSNMAKFAHIYDHWERLYDKLGYSCPHAFIREFLDEQGIPSQELTTPTMIYHSPSGVVYAEPDTGKPHEPTE